MTAELRMVDIATMIDIDDCDGAGSVIDAVDDPVRAATGTEPVVQRGKQPLAYPVRFTDQRSRHELVRRDGDRLRQALAERPADGRGGPQFVRLGSALLAHAAEDRRWRMVSARSSAETISPRA